MMLLCERCFGLEIFSVFLASLQVYGALRVAVKMLLMLNSQIEVDGGGNTVVTTSILEVRNLAVLKVALPNCATAYITYTTTTKPYPIIDVSTKFLIRGFDVKYFQGSSIISSNANLVLYGQGHLELTGQDDTIKGQRVSLSLFYNITVRI